MSKVTIRFFLLIADLMILIASVICFAASISSGSEHALRTPGVILGITWAVVFITAIMLGRKKEDS